MGCSFCYLGGRPASRDRSLLPTVAADVVARLPANDIAIAVSEPAWRWREQIEAVFAAAAARGLPVAVTTTPEVAAQSPWVLAGAARLTLSIDPEKHDPARPETLATDGDVDLEALAQVVAACARPGLEIIGLASLITPDWCDRLAGGRLAELLEIPGIDAIALNGLKPPPPWCDRAFWLRFLRRIDPLLARHLNRRLHLDCYVNARILGLSACPAKPDVSPGREFRACVYQRRADFVFQDAEDLAARVADYEPPAVCPFPIF